MHQAVPPRDQQSYRHEAFLYHDEESYVRVLAPFVEQGIDSGEPVMVATLRRHATWLREALGRQARSVTFVDMAELGRNPARIIPAWQQFLDEQTTSGRPVRGIGEPIWSGRRPEEILECQLHEALLNVSVDPKIPFWLVCPYDTARLEPALIDEAFRSHPAVLVGDGYRPNPAYGGRAHVETSFGTPLPVMLGTPTSYEFDAVSADDVFGHVVRAAYAAGLWSDQSTNLAATVRRLARCSLRRGAGTGTIRLWDGPHALTCEVVDPTRINDVMAGRRAALGSDKDGLWTANQLCDLVQLRSTSAGTTVRLHIWK